eukprot:scaffold23640_cov132-Isochrysis_galbana.AAC.4
MLRWVHGQATDPLAVLMFVRVLDPNYAANNFVDVRTQYILPLTNPRVQVQYLVGQTGRDARYVRIISDGIDFHIKSLKVQASGIYSELPVQAVVLFSQNVINADNVLVL